MYMAGDRTGPGPDVTTKQAMVAQSQLCQLLAKNWFPNGVGWKRRANNERTSLVRSLLYNNLDKQETPPPSSAWCRAYCQVFEGNFYNAFDSNSSKPVNGKSRGTKLSQ
jgi:hypothetical protein